MEATSSLKQAINNVGIFLGAVSILALLPIIWVLGAVAEGTANGLSSIEYYAEFILDRPMVLSVMGIFIVWMMIALCNKENK